MLLPRSLKVVYTADRYGDTFQVDRDMKEKRDGKGKEVKATTT